MYYFLVLRLFYVLFVISFDSDPNPESAICVARAFPHRTNTFTPISLPELLTTQHPHQSGSATQNSMFPASTSAATTHSPARPTPSPTRPNNHHHSSSPPLPSHNLKMPRPPRPLPQPPASAHHLPPSPPEPIRSKNFTYSSAGFTFGAKFIPRDPPAVMQQTFSPHCTTDQYVNTTLKFWLVAQCTHWDLAFKRPLDADDLRFILICALQDGRISEERGVPAKMLELEGRMRVQWEERVAEYEREMRAWSGERLALSTDVTEEAREFPEVFVARYFLDEEARPDRGKTEGPVVLGALRGTADKLAEAVKGVEGLACYVTERMSIVCWGDVLIPGVEKAFEGIKEMEEARRDPLFRPTIEAHFDIDRFVAKYFLDGMFGKPERTRTPNPVVIRGWFGGIRCLQRLLNIIVACEGLSVCYFTDENGEDFAILGWYEMALKEQKRLEKAMKLRLAEREKARQEAENRPWVEALMPHFAYLERRQFIPESPNQFFMNELVGSWIVKCPVIEKDWGGAPGNMSLDIWADKPRNKFGLVAAFDLALVKGTALIAQSDEFMQGLEDYMEGYTSEKEVIMDRAGGWRRKYRNVAKDPALPVKLANLLSTPVRGSGKVYLHWMGRQIGEESAEIDPDNKNTGCIGIDMQTRVVGKGAIRYPRFFSSPLDIWVYKVSDEPQRLPKRWSHFCTLAPDVTKYDPSTDTVAGSVSLSKDGVV